MNLNDIKLVIPHQASGTAVQAYSKIGGFKKKTFQDVQAILKKIQEDADKRRDKNKKLKKFAKAMSIFDPTGLVSGTVDAAEAYDIRESLKKMKLPAHLEKQMRGSFMSAGLEDYREDVEEHISSVDDPLKAFGEGWAADLSSKLIGGRAKFSDIGKMFKEGFEGFGQGVKEAGFEGDISKVLGGRGEEGAFNVKDLMAKISGGETGKGNLFRKFFGGLKGAGTSLGDMTKDEKEQFEKNWIARLIENYKRSEGDEFGLGEDELASYFNYLRRPSTF